ncbi:MAG: hypothetical protein AAFX85_03130 [Pseudomonadota bacterium]
MVTAIVAKRKLYAQLDVLEGQLEEQLRAHLRVAARGGNDLVFCVASFNSHPELRHERDETTERLVALGAQILALREKLGEPAHEHSAAVRICWYCREWGELADDPRRGTVALAQRFLEELEVGSTDDGT